MADGRTTVEGHLDRVLATITALPPVEVSLADAAGRVLAADVTAAVAVPRFDHAAMDGFAVRAAEVASASAEIPAELPVVGTVAAGDAVDPLPEGAAIRIMTGAPVPPGADLVVPFEWTSGTDPVRIRQAAPAGRHIRRTGEDVAAGDVALRAGTRLGPAQLGLLAAVGHPSVSVRPRPRIAVISTGAELVDAARSGRNRAAKWEESSREVGEMAVGAVADSNTVTLAAAARSAGAEVSTFGPVSDDAEAFRGALADAADSADLVVTTGGISAGDHDVVKAALRDIEGFWFGSVAIRPGRPQGVGVVSTVDGRGVPVVTLPGTPVAAYSSFVLFVLPALRALAGLEPEPRERAPLGAPVQATDRTVLLPGAYDDSGHVSPLPGHAGHSQRLLAEADVLLVVPPTGALLRPGAVVEVVGLVSPRTAGGC